MFPNLQRLSLWLGLAISLLAANASFFGQRDRANAQAPMQPKPIAQAPSQPPAPPSVLPTAQAAPLGVTNYPTCQPPAAAEFLLLVVTRSSDSQTQVGQLLPPNTAIATCTYLDKTVTRVGGFRTVERANAWARYITESTGLAAYVARPAVSSTASALAPTNDSVISPPAKPDPTKPDPTKPDPTKPDPAKTGTELAYAPKALSAGYAVLVDYANKLQIVTKLQQALNGSEIGLVSYNQRPYLLATHTSDAAAAKATLRSLSDRGFSATLVDSRQVILLRQPVAGTR
jgi:hypothetical protein